MKRPLSVDQMLEILREMSEQGKGDLPLVQGKMGGVCESISVVDGNYLAEAELVNGMVVLGFVDTDDFQLQGAMPSETTWY